MCNQVEKKLRGAYHRRHFVGELHMCLVIDPRSFGFLRPSLCSLCYKYFLEH